MLAVLAVIAFALALILKLVGSHGSWLQWLLIIGGLLVSAAVAWGWGHPYWAGRSRQAPPPPSA